MNPEPTTINRLEDWIKERLCRTADACYGKVSGNALWTEQLKNQICEDSTQFVKGLADELPQKLRELDCVARATISERHEWLYDVVWLLRDKAPAHCSVTAHAGVGMGSQAW